MKRHRITMPKWPAYIMGAFAVACAYPALTMPPPDAAPRAVESAPEGNATLQRDASGKPVLHAKGVVRLGAS